MSSQEIALQAQQDRVRQDRLVRYCRRFVGDPQAANDLAQDAMIVAWQDQDRLRDTRCYDPWVLGIARNLCRRWIRNDKRESAWRAEANPLHETAGEPDIELQRDSIDLEVELEQSELAELLDRALAELPPLTRTVLIERFIHERPQAEIAQRLRTSEGAIEARIQRGKLSLHRLLTTQYQSEAAAYGLCGSGQDVLQQTRIWCPNCGAHHLMGFLGNDGDRALRMHCPGCDANWAIGDVPGLFDGIHGYRAALSRFSHWHDQYFQTALVSRQIRCLQCGQLVPLIVDGPSESNSIPGCSAYCQSCAHWAIQTDVASMVLSSPTAQAFWRRHPRISMSPVQTIEISGVPGLLITLHDCRGTSIQECVVARETLRPLAI